jgi:hypothetical protein
MCWFISSHDFLGNVVFRLPCWQQCFAFHYSVSSKRIFSEFKIARLRRISNETHITGLIDTLVQLELAHKLQLKEQHTVVTTLEARELERKVGCCIFHTVDARGTGRLPH